MPSAAERFLEQKRKQQSNGFTMEINAVAPSAVTRYGLDDMGGYNMESGVYTGNGPDNITQRQVPTQRRIDANGNPYYVDENEVVVIDSETLNEYGGPEALNKFIQENRPGRQFYRGGVPSSQGYAGGIGSGTSMPIAKSNGMAQGKFGYRQYFCGGVPTRQYYGGGIPTQRKNYAISPEQKEMLSEIDGMARQYQDGGTPTRDRGIFDKTNIPQPRTPNIPGANNVINNLPKLSNKVVPTTPQTQGDNNRTGPFGTKKKKKSNGTFIPNQIVSPTPPETQVNPITLPVQNFIPNQIVSPTPPETQVNPITLPQEQSQGQKPPIETRPPVYTPSDYDEMIANRYLGRMGAQQEAQRAAEAQRGMQAGLSEREVMGRGAIGDVGRREAMAEATADFATTAAQRAEDRNKWQQQFDLQQKQFNLGKDQVEYNKNIDALQTALNAGDFKTASNIFSDTFGSQIDLNKAEAIHNSNTAINAINDMINGLGDNADPNTLATLGAIKGAVYQSVFSNIGIDMENGTITNPDGSVIDVNEIIDSINSGNTNQDQTNTILGIGKNSQDWLDNTLAGEIFKSSVTATPKGKSLIDKVASGDESAAEEYGQLITSYISQESNNKLFDSQKDILKKYGLYDESKDIEIVTWDMVAPTVDDIEKALKENNIEKAKQIYDSQSEETQKVIGDINDYIDKHKEQQQTMNSLKFGNYNEVIEVFPKSKDDPLYQNILDDESTVSGFGSKEEHTGDGNNQYYFKNLGTKSTGMKVESGDIINYEGRLLVFKNVHLETKSGSDNNIYNFYDPLTGEKLSIKAAKGGTSLLKGWR